MSLIDGFQKTWANKNKKTHKNAFFLSFTHSQVTVVVFLQEELLRTQLQGLKDLF